LFFVPAVFGLLHGKQNVSTTESKEQITQHLYDR
jgi:hypothetical protein